MYNNAQYINTFDKDAYKSISDIHEQMDEEIGTGQPDPDKMMDLYLRELNQALFLGGRLTKDYGMGRPF